LGQSLRFPLAITKNGLQRLAGPPALDLSKLKTDKKITDEEVLEILKQPLAKETKPKHKKKKKPAKKAAAGAGDDEDESDDEE
jgi:topoisomerase IA-like protein